MGRPQQLPDAETLHRLVAQGMTHQQIVDWVWETRGERITRSAVSVALSRAGLADQAPRYREEIPWELTGKELKAYPVRMLRLLGRRRAGGELNEEEETRLNNWLAKLKEEHAVVAYCADAEPRIIYVPREPGDPRNIPIRKEPVYLNP